MTSTPTTTTNPDLGPDLGAVIALGASVASPAQVYAEPMKYGLRAVEALVGMLRYAGHGDRVTEPLVEWIIENTPAAELETTARRLGIVLAETA